MRIRRPVPRQLGFTLFEVAISTVLVTFGVVSVMVLMPQGIKAQQIARFQIHAAVMMQNITRQMTAPAQQHFNVTVESEKLSDNLYLNRAMASLENIADGSNLGVAPVPLALCQRIDSDQGEIQRIIAGGGRLYYNLPGGPPQGLVMGFVGLPQQNALPNHPCLAWPYWDQHPCMVSAWERKNWELNQSTWPGFAELKILFDNHPHFKSTTTPAASTVTLANWQLYRTLTQALVRAVAAETDSGLTTRITPAGLVLDPPIAFPAPLTPDGAWNITSEAQRRNVYPKPYVVWAASHLAHAAAYGTAGVRVGATTTPATADEIRYARETYESCRQWVARAVAADPYDWGVARQTAQQSAFDFPLLQHDLFPAGGYPFFEDSLSDAVVVPPEPPRKDRAWRVVAPRTVKNYGQARGMYGTGPGSLPALPANKPNIDAGWGDPNHFHLTRRFDPSERMRQVVFWSVDWQSYEDFETLPAPAHDASMGFKDSYGIQLSADWWGVNLPERNRYWTTLARNQTAGAIRGANGGNQTYDATCDTQAYKEGFFMGIHGADRNGNGRVDRGPMPASARLRATLVARFTIYDRVLMGELRH